MSGNLFATLRSLTAGPALQVGTVQSIEGTTAVLLMPGGGRLTARISGTVAIHSRVWVRGGVIEGSAPNLPPADIEV